MKCNQNVRITCSKVMLVPYRGSHVQKYHGWMADADLRSATSSEPLTLEEEYEMQETWREDPHKCTFIVLDLAAWQRSRCELDSMIGDVNLFLMPDDPGVAEISVMIAEAASRGQGRGKESTLAMMKYGADQLRIRRFVAKILWENTESVRLFSSLGFVETSRCEIFRESTWELEIVDPLFRGLVDDGLLLPTYRVDLETA